MDSRRRLADGRLEAARQSGPRGEGAHLQALLPSNVDVRVAELRKRLSAVDRKLALLAEAIEEGGASIPLLVKELEARQAERDAVRPRAHDG